MDGESLREEDQVARVLLAVSGALLIGAGFAAAPIPVGVVAQDPETGS